MSESSLTHLPSELNPDSLLGHLPDPVLVCQEGGQLVYANGPARTLLNQHLDTRLQASVRDFVEVFDPADAAQAQQVFRARAQSWTEPLRLFGDPACIVRLWVSTLSATSGSSWVLVRLRDITTPQQDLKRLRHLAYQDRLTGLPNRPAFMKLLEERLKLYHEDPEQLFAVLLVDIDRFQRINDRFGHHVGDELLCQFVDRVNRRLRDEDVIARLAGDQFAILLRDIDDTDHMMECGQRIAGFAAEPFEPRGQTCYINLSVGAMLVSPEISDPRNLIRFADLAMYQAKSENGGAVISYDHALHTSMERSSQLEDDLRQALADDQLKLHYQPIVDPETGRIVSLEALARWEHPSEGSISPAEFIPIAEESDLIADLSRWTLWQACKQAFAWRWNFRSYGDLSISVNMSARELVRPDFSDMIGEVLGDTGLSGPGLDIEITENVLLETPDRTLEELQMIRVFGAQLSIDDFGTGYSSLSYIQQLPVGRVKIDRQFIRELPSSEQDREIVQVVMELADKLDLEVVAEGVETQQQLDALRELGRPLVQGYYYSPPRPAEEIEELLGRSELEGSTWK